MVSATFAFQADDSAGSAECRRGAARKRTRGRRRFIATA